MTLTPAYGRDYKSAKEALEDFHADKDFIIADIGSRWCGKPVNRQQLTPGTHTLRYARMTKAVAVVVL